ncbi:MAG: hypothetical protein FWF54_02355 [Candidatus Azobacteroides sp.]|nr:hypothetical protein [Candidatus Azobacteroides sp.]
MKRLPLTCSVFLLAVFLFARTVKNPFIKYEIDKIKDEFEEFHDNKNVVEKGTVSYDTKTNYTYGMSNPGQFAKSGNRIDVWEINQDGRIVNHYNDAIQDAFYMVNANGKRIGGKSIFFKYGTVSQSMVTITYKNRKGWSYDLYSVKGIDNADALFTFMANNTNVEFSLGIFGKEKGGETSNFITTTHQGTTEGGMRDVYMKQFMAGNVMMENMHNHPAIYDAPYPSGLPDISSGRTGDVPFAKSVVDNTKRISAITPIFWIYDPKTGQKIPYGPNSVKSDFSYFKR